MPSRLLPLLLALLALPLAAGEDPYAVYVRTSKDFTPVRQDRATGFKAWPSWVYMPWYYQWTIGFDDAAGRFCEETGYNGAFTNYGDTRYLAWIDKFKLRFYNDHTAGKGDLYLRDSNKIKAAGMGPVRPVLLDAAMKTRIEERIRGCINKLKASPNRAAYSLDDEVSWGSFVKPCMWQITDEANYRRWLEEIYGAGKAPAHPGWTDYNQLLPRLPGFTLGSFDASQLMDQWSFNDSWWNNFIGDLVGFANGLDPDTPVGYVGGQTPNAFGGYDYAKLMRKVQFAEFYYSPDDQWILQSFNPQRMPIVSTHFHKASRDTIWQFFACLAHGNRGHIGWVEGWFDGATPKPFHAEIAPVMKELGSRIGPLQAQADPLYDGVLIYYSHASIQMSWILDAQAHGSTWPNRNGDGRLGTSHLTRRAWVNMLRDEGLQPKFLSYVDLLQGGIPAGTRVLILPAVYCLSDAEAVRIREFCQAGGTVLADILPGVFDQHGKGRPAGGALDDLFAARHDPGLKAADLFQGKDNLWVEVDQDVHFEYRTYADFLADNTCVQDASGFNKAVRKLAVGTVNPVGKGMAQLFNLSPISYLAMRQAGFAAAKKRAVFMQPVRAAGVAPAVEVAEAEPAFGAELVRWRKDGRTLLFLVGNLEVSVGSEGGGNSVGLRDAELDVTLRFAKPITGVRDERSGKALPDGASFPVKWKMNEAVVLSYQEP